MEYIEEGEQRGQGNKGQREQTRCEGEKGEERQGKDKNNEHAKRMSNGRIENGYCSDSN